MKSRNRGQEARTARVTQAASARITDEEIREKAQKKDGIYLKGGIYVGCLMIVASLGIYAFPNFMKSDTQLAQEESILQLEACRQVFQSIGIMLSEGNVPDSTMSCPGTNIPNIVQRSGNRITVSHPNPRQFGLTELYVTNESHRVVMTGLNPS